MSDAPSTPVTLLLRRGVRMPNPATVTVDPSVHIERIAPGVVLHPGCRIVGAGTSIGPGCVLGEEAPATLDNCQLGAQVRLAGGYFSEATFLARSSMGSGAQVRPGTLVEEEAGGAHAVGLKQTILFPYATLGSLINFCDALVAGGDSRRHHSEVGSSYVHFNFTPHGDKATPSLVGDVPRGVMLNQPPVFLGGQGGLVGPARVEFGAVVPAGVIVRSDIRSGGLFVPEPRAAKPGAPFQAGAYRSIRRIVGHNLAYLGNILALRAWYRRARPRFLGADPFQAACLAGAAERLATVFDERLRRLKQLAENMPRSLALARTEADDFDAHAPPYLQQQQLIESWPRIEEALLAMAGAEGDAAPRDALLECLARAPARTDYLAAIHNLGAEGRAAGTAWLNSIVSAAGRLWPPA